MRNYRGCHPVNVPEGTSKTTKEHEEKEKANQLRCGLSRGKPGQRHGKCYLCYDLALTRVTHTTAFRDRKTFLGRSAKATKNVNSNYTKKHRRRRNCVRFFSFFYSLFLCTLIPFVHVAFTVSYFLVKPLCDLA